MQQIKSSLFAFVFAIIGIVGLSANAAPVLIVDGGGQLLGADNVDLGALGLFNVRFVDGSCVSLFSGCDNPVDDFAFQTFGDANIAAAALLAQVFVNGSSGNFDADPTLTFGCTQIIHCDTRINYSTEFLNDATAVFTRNAFFSNADSIFVNSLAINFDTTGSADINFARFTSTSSSSIPEPGTISLLGVGLLGLGHLRRRRKTA